MTSLYGSNAMTAGYAAYRPPLHALILERARPHLRPAGKAPRALDVGCGAGLSTRALRSLAEQCVGIEPVEAMLGAAAATAPGCAFAAARAEAIPLRDRSIDLITAAGSLNYVDLGRFFAEAARVLVPDGAVLVYDFSPGREFRDSPALRQWFAAFVARYPWPADGAAELDPERLGKLRHGFDLRGAEEFEIGIPLARRFYLEYMMTETNVASAVRNGRAEASIREWCAETLADAWPDGEREVLFRGYWACLVHHGR